MPHMSHDTLIMRTLPYRFNAAGCIPITSQVSTSYANRRMLTLLRETKFPEATYGAV